MAVDGARRLLRRLLSRMGALPYLGLVRDCLSVRGRQRLTDDWYALRALRRALGGNGIAPVAGQGPAFLVYGGHNVASVVLALPMLMAARCLGYRLWALLPIRNPMIKRAYELCGVGDFVFLDSYLKDAPHPQADLIQSALVTAGDLKEVAYKGCRVGKFCLSTLMRWNRMGSPDIHNPQTAEKLGQELSHSLRAADAAEAVVSVVEPKLALFNERGYSPYGEFFDSVLNHGGTCITWNSGHRNDMQIVKRYHHGNVDANHFSLSEASWARIKRMPWSEGRWLRLRNEIVSSYQSGEWFSECATQFDKTSVEHDALVRRLGLDPARPTVCVFPHMFWDATFFWGEDLFDNYEHWFTEVLKVAAQNRALNWIVKIHPANVAKAIRDGYRGEYSETLAIRRTLGDIPDHIKVVPPESDISTLSLLSVIDYCLTVRGTIGIEAAAFGIRVLTAGTGRYDRRGFTLDSATSEDYLNLLRRLPDVAPMSVSEIELARRFAYGVFMARPTPLVSVSFGFRGGLAAALQANVQKNAAMLAEAADVRSLAEWIASGEDDYLSPAVIDRTTSAELTATDG